MREVARVLLLNEHSELLLLKGGDPTDPNLGSWWFTPGGGVEEGESHQAAARRELWEETGLDLEVTGAPLWERVASFEFMGTAYHQRELFFVAQTAKYEPTAKLLTNIEQESLQGWKWWSESELLETKEQVYPADLGELFSTIELEPKTTTVLPTQEFELPKAQG